MRAIIGAARSVGPIDGLSKLQNLVGALPIAGRTQPAILDLPLSVLRLLRVAWIREIRRKMRQSPNY